MTHWVRTRSPLVRALVYVTLAILAFALSAGVGALGALTLRGDLTGSPERQEPRPSDRQDADRAQREDGNAKDGNDERDEAATEQKGVAPRQEQAAADRSAGVAQRDEAGYADAVEDIQAGAVETFLNSHEKLLRYDALAADDVQEMGANETALRGMVDRAADLAPPRKYEEQHEVFGSAIEELHEAARLAHGMAADPVTAAGLGFDEYDGHVTEASSLLRRSNELLGKDYETIGNVREVSPEL